MKILKNIAELKDILLTLKQSNKKVGLVHTMGNIHNGHLSLLKKAKENDDFVIATNIYESNIS
jgi:Panthothenate synthetase